MNNPSDTKHIHSSLFKKKTTALTHENKKKENLKKIKKSTLYYMVAISTICLIIVIERVISNFITEKENFLIIFLQKSFGITKKTTNPSVLLKFISNISDVRYFSLMNTHIYIIIYFGIDAFIATKIMLIHYIGLFLCYFLQIIYKAPRPFWVDSQIISYSCDGDFLLPNDLFFSYIFIFMYIFYNFRRKKGDSNETLMKTIVEIKEEDVSFFHNAKSSENSQSEENNGKKNWIEKIKGKSMVILKSFIVIIFILLIFLRYLIGVVYLEAVFMSIVYCVLYYIFIIFIDGYIEDFVKRSTIIIKESKKYMFKWLMALLLVEFISFILFFSTFNYSKITWIKNYVSFIDFLLSFYDFS